MAAYLITHSLLSSWLHLIRENPYEDLTTEGDPLAEFMLVLKREPTPRTEAIGRVKILSGHNDSLLPIGIPTELREDAKGLFMSAKISDTTLGRDVKTLIHDGVLCELSIGYDPVVFDYDENGIRHLREVKLWEISVVTFGNLRLSAKRLEAIVPQTRELLMSTKYSADELFAADLSRRMQLGLDWGALYGTGGEFQPTGIANTPGVEKIDAKKMDAQYAADGKLTADFPVYVKSLVMSKNVDDQALGWAFNSFMEGYLKNIKTTTGDYIYRDEMNAGNFLGMPYKVSNQIPTDSKTGCTEMFFGNWADLMIGDQMGLETYTTLDGTWTDENGVQHNAFEENLTGTRALMYDDIGVRHVESFAYVHNIKVI